MDVWLQMLTRAAVLVELSSNGSEGGARDQITTLLSFDMSQGQKV